MEVFAIAPATSRGMLLILLIPVSALALVFVLFGASLLGARTARFEVSPAGLRLKGDLYGRLIPADQIAGRSAHRVNFARMPEFEPRWRTMGTGLPGYRAGWFRLRSGEKALVYLTDRDRAVYVPTTAGYGVLVSPADPDGFVAAVAALGNGR